MPKKFHRQLYTPELMQLLDPNEQHFNANEAHLLQLIADLATEVMFLCRVVKVLQKDIAILEGKIQ